MVVLLGKAGDDRDPGNLAVRGSQREAAAVRTALGDAHIRLAALGQRVAMDPGAVQAGVPGLGHETQLSGQVAVVLGVGARQRSTEDEATAQVDLDRRREVLRLSTVDQDAPERDRQRLVQVQQPEVDLVQEELVRRPVAAGWLPEIGRGVGASADDTR